MGFTPSTTAAQHQQHLNMDGCTTRSPNTQSPAAGATSDCTSDTTTNKITICQQPYVFMHLCRGCSEKDGSRKDKEGSVEST